MQTALSYLHKPFSLYQYLRGATRVNAAEQATSLEVASKIATVVNLFKAAFPDAKADLKPWLNDPQSRELMDPDSIDIGFHLPGWSPRFQSRSILVQIRFYADSLDNTRRAIGIEVAGFTHLGKQWQFSTVGSWHFEGTVEPAADIAVKFKDFARLVLDLFNS
jgi:hypothetical protein